MIYQPGFLHEKLQTEIAIELIADFNMPICRTRLSDSDYEDDVDVIQLKENDIIIVKWFRPRLLSPAPYAYVVRSNNIDINRESTLSKEFIEMNTKNGILFRDVTKRYNREQKINSILLK